MSKRIVHNTVLWSIAVLGTLWIGAGLAVGLWSELHSTRRPIRIQLKQRPVVG